LTSVVAQDNTTAVAATCEYIGFDVNGSYIAAAQGKYGDRGTFVVGDTRAIWDNPRFPGGGHCHWMGILHHLDDEQAAHCIRFAHRALKQGGPICMSGGVLDPEPGIRFTICYVPRPRPAY